MKKFTQAKIKKELMAIGVDELTIQLVTNNISLYNDLIDEYKNDSKHQSYLMYQLNVQIFKMLNEIKKQKSLSKDDQDEFTSFIDNFKKKIETR